MTGPEPEKNNSGQVWPERPGSQFILLCLTAVGVVYGDIGTSPLYALRVCFHGAIPLEPSPANVLGVLSLIFWALTIVISVKYLLLLLRADNRGEGGILALMALLNPWSGSLRRERRFIIILGLFGAALLYGDGVITPAISVLSAIEGLKIATPAFEPYVAPLTAVIIFLLFLIQKRGTARVGALFGPVMTIWFLTISFLGIAGIMETPEVLSAVNPLHGAAFFLANGRTGFIILGSVFLVVTGGEALYADMGHFGRKAIRRAWFVLVFPALLLNYFGQGALILRNPEESLHPFYHLAPGWALYPLVILSTLATVIASQAVISGAFSLTRQAVQLNLCPRVRIIQTSSEEIGQIYVPFVNWALMITTIALVFGFKTGEGLAAAYGVAVTTTMVITTTLIFFLMREQWKWNLMFTSVVAALFLAVDLSFFAANMLKVRDGGWFPLTAGLLVFILMATWRRGRELLSRQLLAHEGPLDEFLAGISEYPPHRVPGTAVFMTSRSTGAPPMLLHHLAHNQALHEQVILLTIVTGEVPRVPAAERLKVKIHSGGFARVIVHYGFMQSPNVPVALRECEVHGLAIDQEKTTYYLARETLIPTTRVPGMMIWREKLFAFLSRNALRATIFYNIPPERVVELGIQVEI
jgi:KUP system potassium uptake protein